MADYNFETITAAQALLYESQYDSLVFTTPGESAGNTFFDFLGDASQTPIDGHIRVSSAVTGTSVLFTAFLGLERAIPFPDGTTAAVGRIGYGLREPGGPGNEAFFGAPMSGDDLHGGAGADTLDGGGGGDELYGGAGADLFVFRPSLYLGVDVIALSARVYDWEQADHLSFGGLAATASNYFEGAADNAIAAKALANQQIASGGVDFVAVQVNSGGLQSVYLFADSNNDDGGADNAVRFYYKTLDDFSYTNFVAKELTYAAAPPPPISPPPPPPPTSPGASGRISGNMDLVHLSYLTGVPIVSATSSQLSIQGGPANLTLSGSGFTYDAQDQITGGSATHLLFGEQGAAGPYFGADLALSGLSVGPFAQWVQSDATQVAFATVLAGSDQLSGEAGANLIRGYAGDDVIRGYGINDSLFGGLGDDTIYAGGQQFGAIPISRYLRGDEGNDQIYGAGGFDDINGNAGNDTAHGGDGDDWCVGGKDNDLLFGDAGGDVVWGNLGNDTLDGGDGDDQVRGGQGDDSVSGGAGNDFVSGDRGNDTVAGGNGADLFHGSQDAGIDRVIDFHLAQGDRVMLDPGTTYAVSQVGADTVIDMGGANQMILVGVQMSTLTPGWIFLG